MAEYTYPVIVKPAQSNNGVLGIEYWFPDFEECEHIFFEDITDDGAAVCSAGNRLRHTSLVSGVACWKHTYPPKA